MILIKQKGFIIAFCLSAIITSLLLTYIVSEKYEAGISIYYRPKETSLMREKNIEAFGSPAPSPSFKVILQTLKDIIHSEAILRPVVEELELYKPIERHYETWYEEWYYETKKFIIENGKKLWMILKYGRIIEIDPVIKAINSLRENIDVSASKESYVYIITCKDKYPERAAIIVDRIGEKLVEWLNNQDINPAKVELRQIENHINEIKKKLDYLRSSREKMLKKYGIVSISDEIDDGVATLYNMNREISSLNSEIEKKKRIIRELAEKIEEYEKRKNIINPDDFKKIKSEKLFKEIELEGLIKQRESILDSIKDLEDRLNILRKLKKTEEDILTDIEALNREYTHMKDLYVEALTKAMSEEGEVKIMHHSIVPAKPVQPIKIYNVALSGVLALFFSAGLVYVFAFFNIRIFFASEGVKGRKKTSESDVSNDCKKSEK